MIGKMETVFEVDKWEQGGTVLYGKWKQFLEKKWCGKRRVNLCSRRGKSKNVFLGRGSERMGTMFTSSFPMIISHHQLSISPFHHSIT